MKTLLQHCRIYDGTGMDDQTLLKIFKPLFTTKDIGKGTGLGLPVVKQILLDHHAKISVKSKPGTGTAFTLIFASLD